MNSGWEQRGAGGQKVLNTEKPIGHRCIEIKWGSLTMEITFTTISRKGYCMGNTIYLNMFSVDNLNNR